MSNSLTIAEAAERYGIGQHVLYRAIKQGELAAIPPRPTSVVSAGVEAWLKTRRGRGKPRLGEITYKQAADMLSMTPAGVAYHVREGNLPCALTARAVVEFALGRNDMMMWGESWTVQSSTNKDKFVLGDTIHLRFREGTLDQIIREMQQIAPLTEWRVVKE